MALAKTRRASCLIQSTVKLTAKPWGYKQADPSARRRTPHFKNVKRRKLSLIKKLGCFARSKCAAEQRQRAFSCWKTRWKQRMQIFKSRNFNECHLKKLLTRWHLEGDPDGDEPSHQANVIRHTLFATHLNRCRR